MTGRLNGLMSVGITVKISSNAENKRMPLFVFICKGITPVLFPQKTNGLFHLTVDLISSIKAFSLNLSAHLTICLHKYFFINMGFLHHRLVISTLFDD